MPHDYPIKSIGDTCLVGDGAHSKVARVNQGVPYLTSKNIKQGGLDLSKVDYISESDYERLFTVRSGTVRRPEAGDVLMGIIGTFGNHYLYKEDDFFGVSSAVALLRPKREVLLPEYLCVVCSSRQFKDSHQQIKSGSVQGYTNISTIKTLPVPLPPLTQQKAIAHILGTFDDQIELNRKTNKTLEGIAKALFKSWFVDFDPVRAKAEGRPTGLPDEISELFPDSFEESELGEIPSGWMIESAGKHLELIKGRSYKSAELQESKTALVTLKSFQRGGGYREDGLKPYIGTFKENQVIQPGELIIALTDVTQAADVIGRPAIVRTSEGRETLVASLDVGIVRKADHGLLPQAFIYELFRTENYVSHALSYTSGTTVLHLAKGVLADFQIVIPPIELIRIFTSLSESVLNRIDISSQESRSLQKLRDTLLPRLISGELRVPDAEKMLEEVGI